MSYIAADMWGEHLFYNKPVRYVHETTKRSWWIDPKHNNSISVPIGTAKLFNDAGFLYTHYVPFDKRNMCFGDNPIEIKVYWLLGHWMNRLDTGLWNSDPLDRNIYWIIGWIQGKLNKKCSEITFFTCQSWAKLRVHSKKVQRLLEEYSFLNNQQERPTP